MEKRSKREIKFYPNQRKSFEEVDIMNLSLNLIVYPILSLTHTLSNHSRIYTNPTKIDKNSRKKKTTKKERTSRTREKIKKVARDWKVS